MADENEEDVLELDNEVQDENTEQSEPQDDDIFLEGEEEQDDDPTIKKVREAARDANRRARQAEERLAELQQGNDDLPDPGVFPDFDDPQYEYDSNRLRAAQEEWHRRNNAIQARKDRQTREATEQQNRLRDLDVKYRSSATKLAPANAAVFDDADRAFREALGDDAPVVLAEFFKEPAKLVVALHKYPARLQAIADEPNITKKILLMKEVEMAIKTGNRRPAPAPESETIQRGTASVSGTSDKRMQQLEAQAAKTGDRSALIAYRASKNK